MGGQPVYPGADRRVVGPRARPAACGAAERFGQFRTLAAGRRCRARLVTGGVAAGPGKGAAFGRRNRHGTASAYQRPGSGVCVRHRGPAQPAGAGVDRRGAAADAAGRAGRCRRGCNFWRDGPAGAADARCGGGHAYAYPAGSAWRICADPAGRTHGGCGADDRRTGGRPAGYAGRGRAGCADCGPGHAGWATGGGGADARCDGRAAHAECGGRDRPAGRPPGCAGTWCSPGHGRRRGAVGQRRAGWHGAGALGGAVRHGPVTDRGVAGARCRGADPNGRGDGPQSWPGANPGYRRRPGGRGGARVVRRGACDDHGGCRPGRRHPPDRIHPAAPGRGGRGDGAGGRVVRYRGNHAAILDATGGVGRRGCAGPGAIDCISHAGQRDGRRNRWCDGRRTLCGAAGPGRDDRSDGRACRRPGRGAAAGTEWAGGAACAAGYAGRRHDRRHGPGGSERDGCGGTGLDGCADARCYDTGADRCDRDAGAAVRHDRGAGAAARSADGQDRRDGTAGDAGGACRGRRRAGRGAACAVGRAATCRGCDDAGDRACAVEVRPGRGHAAADAHAGRDGHGRNRIGGRSGSILGPPGPGGRIVGPDDAGGGCATARGDGSGAGRVRRPGGTCANAGGCDGACCAARCGNGRGRWRCGAGCVRARPNGCAGSAIGAGGHGERDGAGGRPGVVRCGGRGGHHRIHDAAAIGTALGPGRAGAAAGAGHGAAGGRDFGRGVGRPAAPGRAAGGAGGERPAEPHARCDSPAAGGGPGAGPGARAVGPG